MNYGALRFIAALIRALQQFPSWAESIQFLVWAYIFLRCILILLNHLRLRLSKGLFPVGLLFKMFKAFLHSSILFTCSAFFNLLDLITLTILVQRPSPLPIFIHLDPNIRLWILFPNVSVHSTLNVRDYFSAI